MGYQGYQGYGPKADIASLLIQQQAAKANGAPVMAQAGAAIPDIGSAEQQAGSSRKIADLLMSRAMSRNQQGDTVNWGTGLGQLGEALLARNANKKADSADAKYADVKAALMKAAGSGNMDALFQLDPSAAIAQKNSDREFGFKTEQAGIENVRADKGLGLQERGLGIQQQGVDLQGRGLDQSAEQFDARMGMDQDQFGQTMAMEREKLAAARAAAEAKAAAEGGPNVDDEGQFRREYMGQAKSFKDVQESYKRIKSTDATTAAGQISLVFQYMKMLDPGSTVREGEFATAENARGVPEGVANTYNKIMQGEFLTSSQVKDFNSQADGLYNGALEGFDNMRKTYESIAPGYGFDAGRVTPDLAYPEYRGAGGPPPPPPEAVQELMSNPTPQEMAEFNQTFGPGAAEALIEQMPKPRTYEVPR